MFGFFINQLNTNGKKLYQKVIDFYKKRIRLERSKAYFEVYIKHNVWPHFTKILLYTLLSIIINIIIIILFINIQNISIRPNITKCICYIII